MHVLILYLVIFLLPHFIFNQYLYSFYVIPVVARHEKRGPVLYPNCFLIDKLPISIPNQPHNFLQVLPNPIPLWKLNNTSILE